MLKDRYCVGLENKDGSLDLLDERHGTHKDALKVANWLNKVESELLIDGKRWQVYDVHKDLGTVQLGRSPPLIVASKTLYVITHPFWKANSRHPYIDNIEKLVRDTEAPILTLDAWLKDTSQRYAKLNPKGDRFFLPNRPDSAEPYCKWGITAEIIKQFRPEEVIFGGSALGKGEDGYHFCVGTSYNELRHLVPNSYIEESLCNIWGSEPETVTTHESSEPMKRELVGYGCGSYNTIGSKSKEALLKLRILQDALGNWDYPILCYQNIYRCGTVSFSFVTDRRLEEAHIKLVRSQLDISIKEIPNFLKL